jgi:hypothetical protein
MSAPPFELIIGAIIALFLGPVVWGYICSKWGRLGLLLLLLPTVILIAIWPGLIHPGALPLFIMYGALASVGFIWSLLKNYQCLPFLSSILSLLIERLAT